MIERIGRATTAEAAQSILAIDRQVDGISGKQGLFKWITEMKAWLELFVL